jgi:hypothetical protein
MYWESELGNPGAGAFFLVWFGIIMKRFYLAIIFIVIVAISFTSMVALQRIIATVARPPSDGTGLPR